MNAAVRKWLPAVAPGLVLVLLAVQILLGFRGFHHPHAGLMGALEIPGRLLGWGGVVLLLPLLAWLLVGWWGFGVTGMALKMLGAVTLGLAVGGLAGLAGGEAAGGRIGASIAALLADALGHFVATLLLLVMAAPGFLLAAARFHATRLVVPEAAPKAPEAPAAETVHGEPPPAFVPPGRSPPPRDLTPPSIPVATAGKSRGWYPERRFDANGNELPMDFGGAKDVGAVRYRDEPPAPARETARASEKPEPAAPPPLAARAQPEAPAAQPDDAPDVPAWPKGLREAPEDDEDAGAAEEAPALPAPVVPRDERPRLSVPSAADRLRPQAARPRPATHPDPAPRPEPAARAEPQGVERAPEGPPAKVFTRSLFPKNPGDPVRLPGVRYRDEEPSSAPAPLAQIPPPPPPAPTPPPAPPPAPTLGPPREAWAAAAASKAAPLEAPPKDAPVETPRPKSGRSGAKARPATPSTASFAFAQADAEPAPAPAAPATPPPAAARPSGPTPKPGPERAAPRAPSSSSQPLGASAPLSGTASDARYQSQLAASGIFDEAPGARPAEPAADTRSPEETAPPEPPAKKGARRTAAASAPPAAPAVKAPAARDAAPKAAPIAGAGAPEPLRAAAKTTTGKPLPLEPLPKPKPAWVQELSDDIFLKAVEASLERGAASAVLLTRRLGIGYGKAQALVDRLAQSGVLGEVTPNGARPVLIRREDFDSARPPP